MKKKRFIAGAICPSCKEQDKVFTYELNDEKFRACSRCDFNEALVFDVPSLSRSELETRVNAVKKVDAEPVQTVRLVDPTKH